MINLGPRLDQKPPTVFYLDKALEFTRVLNAEELDGWTYQTEIINDDSAIIAAFDENGEFAGYF
jgi:hypothetical protein